MGNGSGRGEEAGLRSVRVVRREENERSKVGNDMMCGRVVGAGGEEDEQDGWGWVGWKWCIKICVGGDVWGGVGGIDLRDIL